MGVTVVLSGPAVNRAKAVAQLRQLGFIIEDGEHTHGWTPEPEESFITAHVNHPDNAAKAVEHLDWRPRSHWARTGPWQKVGDEKPDPSEEIAKLKAQLRAQGIVLLGE